MTTKEEPPCSDHPDAPHGFNRNASHSVGRYVCDCEGWTPEPTPPKDMVFYKGVIDNYKHSPKPTPDCRTCEHHYDNKWCSSKALCTNGDQYQPAPVVVLWRTE